MSQAPKPMDIIAEAAHELHRALLRRIHQIRHHPLQAGDDPRAFGIVGERGIGKSTLLYHFYRRWERDNKHEYYLLPPLDCHALPSELNPSTAVLLYLQRALALANDEKKLDQDLHAALKTLAGQEGFLAPAVQQQLAVDLSTSLADYGRITIEAVEHHLVIKTKLHEFIGKVCRALDTPALVLPLDDFDLISGNVVRNWYRALMGDLNQPQLIFILTADLNRLHHLGVDADYQVDDLTGRALVDKLLPPQNRIHLPDWPVPTRLQFQPNFVAGSIDAKPLDELLGQLAENYQPVLAEALLRHLTPRRPRGLTHLYEAIQAQLNSNKANSSQVFLISLASCRSEPLLARRIKEQPIETWSQILAPPKPSSEGWAQTIEACTDIDDLDPLVALVPRNAETSVVTVTRYERPPGWTEPLRHDELLTAPLRDAHPLDQAWWTELLLNAAFSHSTGARLSYFLALWNLFRPEKNSAVITANLSTARVRRFFREGPSRTFFPWFDEKCQRDGNFIELRVGFDPLLHFIRRTRQGWPHDLLESCTVNLAQVRGDPPQVTADDFLPPDLRALVLWVDYLKKVPWEGISQLNLQMEVRTYLQLVAILVRTAYLAILHAWALLKDPDEDERFFLEIIQQHDPSALSRLKGDQEQALKERMERIAQKPLPVTSAAKIHPMAKVAANYVNKNIFKGLFEKND